MKTRQKHVIASLFAVASLTVASVAGAQETPVSPGKGATAQPTVQPTASALQQQPQGNVLVIDQPVQGVVASPNGERWTFSGQQGQLVTLAATSEFDNYLEVYDSRNQLIAEDDDSGGNYNALVFAELPANGVYTVVVTSYNGEATGGYSLELTNGGRPEPGLLSYGEIASTILPIEAEDRWTFEGTQGDVISIAAFGDIDAQLELYDAAGQLLASNDDAFSWNSDAVIDGVTLAANATYTVVVRDYFGEAGRYMLVVGEPYVAVTG